MSKSLRVSEKWFRRGLWLVAVLFASFLIGLGGAVVDDLPQVEQRLELDDYLDRTQAQALRQQLEQVHTASSQAADARDQASLQWDQARADTAAARDTFDSWLATRNATQRSEQDPEVIARRQALEQLRLAERAQQQRLQTQEQLLLNQQQQAEQLSAQLQVLEDGARVAMARAERAQELRVFGYRLALTLPLLVIAGWLFVRRRHTAAWPFVWGFIFFALFAFFVELVPYLPSYGGYVRSVVGIVVTVVLGRWAIQALQRYLERQRQAEALPASQRRRTLSYDAAWAHWSKGICPGCERHVDLKDGVTDFCPHCGIGLYVPCTACSARLSAFAKFCNRCGSAQPWEATGATPAGAEPRPQSEGAPPSLSP